MKPFKVRLRFHGDLNVFLGSKAGDAVIERPLAEKTSIKDVIESCGVPHPEVDLIFVDEQTVGFDHTVDNDTNVEVFPVEHRRTDRHGETITNCYNYQVCSDGHLGALPAIFVCSDLMSLTLKR